jgi:gliding motility-associated-like protein
VIVSDAIGCADTAWVTVELFPEPYVYAGEDVTIDFGDAAALDATGEGIFLWSPEVDITCTDCEDPTVFPETSTLYTVQLTDSNGCIAFDEVYVIVDGTLYVPNTFTPNGDGFNDLFYALASEVKVFKMYVFDRWGLKIFESNDLRKSWDGTYGGAAAPIDTYVWRIDYEEESGEKHKVFGHVNLIR